MTIKVYKKRTHWYYTYHCTEYDLGKIAHLDFLEFLLESKIFYFQISINEHTFVGRIVYNIWSHDYYINGYPISGLMLFENAMDLYPGVKLPVDPKRTLYVNYKSCIK